MAMESAKRGLTRVHDAEVVGRDRRNGIGQRGRFARLLADRDKLTTLQSAQSLTGAFAGNAPKALCRPWRMYVPLQGGANLLPSHECGALRIGKENQCRDRSLT